MMALRAGGEMADTLPLGGSAARHGGSSPLPPTQRSVDHIRCLEESSKTALQQGRFVLTIHTKNDILYAEEIEVDFVMCPNGT